MEFVLDTLPGSEIRSILITVLPHRPPGLQNRARGSLTELIRSCEPALEDATDHKIVRLAIEGIELGGDVGAGSKRGRGGGGCCCCC
ncbi:hypothetical protein DsansV1_C09g0090671 [Dioscorea sansibarensis]